VLVNGCREDDLFEEYNDRAIVAPARNGKKMLGVCGWPTEICQFIDANAMSFDQARPWLECFQDEVLGSTNRVSFVVERSAHGTLEAILPVSVGRVSLAGPLRVRACKAPTNYYSALYGPISRPDVDEHTIRKLASHAVDLAQNLGVVDLAPLAEESAFIGSCLEAFRAAGWFTEIYPRFGNWIEPIGGRNFAEYLRDRPGQVRSTLSRKAKRLRSHASATFRIVSDAREVEGGMAEYEAIYRASWKTDEPFQGFIRQVARSFAQCGWLRLGIVRVNGQPAAAQIWFVHRNEASIFKLAYDPRYGDLSVGSLLTAHLFEHVIDVDRVELVDYLCGDDPYKRDWMTVRRQRVGFRAVRKFSTPGLVEAGRRLVKAVRPRG
jgi:ribosomal protein S18 acetylase RimI-like enzyme